LPSLAYTFYENMNWDELKKSAKRLEGMIEGQLLAANNGEDLEELTDNLHKVGCSALSRYA
jgi:hypothetical protein